MKDVVNRIIKEEEAARILVQEAKAKAEQDIERARKEAKDILGKKAFEVKESCRNRKKAAEETFRREKETMLKKLREQMAVRRNELEKDVDRLAGEIFDRLVGRGR